MSEEVSRIRRDAPGRFDPRTASGKDTADRGKRLGLLAAILLCVPLGRARAEHVYTIADGLSSDLIRSVLSDSRGFLWFGTGDGISLFDETSNVVLPIPAGQTILTATATDPGGNTSEFSVCFPATDFDGRRDPDFQTDCHNSRLNATRSASPSSSTTEPSCVILDKCRAVPVSCTLRPISGGWCVS